MPALVLILAHTGFGNRRAFLSQGETLLAGCARRGEPVALLLDLDHFKRRNDVHAHQTGDHALYAAKDQGRNSVQLYTPPSPPGPASPAATAPPARVD